MVGEVGLEPTKALASGFTVRPLCRSGHSPILGNQSLSKSSRASQTEIATGIRPVLCLLRSIPRQHRVNSLRSAVVGVAVEVAVHAQCNRRIRMAKPAAHRQDIN